MTNIDNKTKQKIIEEYLKNPKPPFGGHRKSYTEIAKEMFPIQPLPQGAAPIYDNRCEKCGMPLYVSVGDFVQGYEHSEEECMLYKVHGS